MTSTSSPRLREATIARFPRDPRQMGVTAARRRRWWVGPLAGFALLFLAAGCGGGSGGGNQNPTPRCVRASDCSGALVCIQGFCVQQCVESKDCPAGQRCIPATGGNSCQPPERSTCTYTSDCTIPLVCGLDQVCRPQCQSDVDCPRGQFCTVASKLCADPTIDTNYDPVTKEFRNMLDAGSYDGPVSTAKRDAAPVVDVSLGADVSLPPPVDAGRPDTTSIPVVEAGVVDAGGADVPLNLDGPPLLVDGVVVTPSPSLRQGQVNATLTVTRAAGGLASAGLFDLGDLTVREQTGGSDTSLILKVSVPHGAPLGKRTLRFAAGGGVVTLADVVDVTAITAGPAGADTNAGSAGSPFLTLNQALLVADAGDTIHLMDGSYTAKGGETWGYVIPDNLTIVGASIAGTIIDGAGATNNPNGFNASTALTLKTLTVQHFYYGIDVKKPNSTVTLQDVVLSGNTNHGIYVESAATGSTVNILGKATLIDQPGETAIYVYNSQNTTVNITDATLQGGSDVIYFYSNSSGGKINVSGATIKQLAGYDAINVSVSSNADGTVVTLDKSTIIGTVYDSDAKGTLAISNSSITEKSGNGIYFGGLTFSLVDSSVTMTSNTTAIDLGGTQNTLLLKGVTVSGGYYGVYQHGAGSAAKVRGTTISGTAYDAYYLTAGDLDLGTATESGDNIIEAPTNTSYYCLKVYRTSGANAGGPVTCSGTTLNGQAPAPDTIDASSGTVTQAPQRYYVYTGNKLVFY